MYMYAHVCMCIWWCRCAQQGLLLDHACIHTYKHAYAYTYTHILICFKVIHTCKIYIHIYTYRSAGMPSTAVMSSPTPTSYIHIYIHIHTYRSAGMPSTAVMSSPTSRSLQLAAGPPCVSFKISYYSYILHMMCICICVTIVTGPPCVSFKISYWS
jgi:hypothetical protein